MNSVPDYIKENKEFRFSNWINFIRYIIVWILLIFVIFYVENSESIILFSLLILVSTLFILWEYYNLPFRVKVLPDELILISRKNEKRIKIDEIKKIGYGFNISFPSYLRFYLKDGTSVRIGPSIFYKNYFFELIQKQNPNIKINKWLNKKQ